MCAFSSCLAFSSPSLAAHYEIRQCVLLQMCQRWGTPSPLAGPLFRFLISSVVFFFPSQPGTSCRGNDNMRGKTTEINNISSHLLPTRLPFSMYPKLVFFCWCGSCNLPANFSICSSTRFILRVATPEPWNWYISLPCINSGGSRTCRFSFSPRFPL